MWHLAGQTLLVVDGGSQFPLLLTNVHSAQPALGPAGGGTEITLQARWDRPTRQMWCAIAGADIVLPEERLLCDVHPVMDSLQPQTCCSRKCWAVLLAIALAGTLLEGGVRCAAIYCGEANCPAPCDAGLRPT